MSNDTTLVARPDVTSDATILQWMGCITGVPEDRMYEGLILDENGAPTPPPVPLQEAPWSYDIHQCRLLQVGQGAQSMLGMSILDLRSRPSLMVEAILPEDRHVLLDLVRIKDFGGEISRDFRLVRSDGELRWIRSRAALVRNGAGRAVRVDGVILDVTEERERIAKADLRRHRAQKQQQAQDRMFKDRDVTHGHFDTALKRVSELAADGMEVDRVGIWLLDESDGRLVCNDLYESGDLLHAGGMILDLDLYPGYVEAVATCRILSAPDVDADDRVAELKRDYLDPLHITSTLDAAIVKGGQMVGVVKHELRGRRREWMSEELGFVSRVADLVANLLERVEREKAEQELALLQTAIEQSPTGIVISTQAGMVNYVNEAFADMMGYERSELLNRSVQTLLAGDAGETMSGLRDEFKHGDGMILSEIIHRRKDGTVFPALVHAGLVEAPNGDGTYVAVSVTDITERKNWETMLREERRRLSTLMSSLPGMAFRVRNAPGWPVEFISEGCVDLIGWRPDDIIDNKLVSHADCVHPEDLAAVWGIMSEAFEKHESYEVEYRIIDSEGNVKWVWEQGLGVYEEGELAAAEGFVCDITDRVEAIEALREGETRYRELFENMNAGVAVLSVTDNGDRFCFKEYNKSGAKLDGVRSVTAIGREVRDLFPGVVDSGLFDVFERVWLTGVPEGLPVMLYDRGQLTSWRENYVYRLPSGEIVCVFEDVTEQIQAQQALRLKQISIDQANDAMIWTLPTGALIDANERAAELYGYSSEDLLNKTIFDLTTRHTPESWGRYWARLRTTLSKRYESWHQRSDGCVIPVEVSTRFLEFEGQEFHCNIVRDLTAQKRHEAEIRRMNEDLEQRVEDRSRELSESQGQLLQSEKMAALGRLVAGMAHEINTPIGIGVTAASHLDDKVSRTRTSYESGTMKRSDFETFLGEAAETSSMILSNLGVASRLIQGFKGVAVDQSDEARRVVVVKDYLEEVLLNLRPRLKHTRIDVQLDCPAHLELDSFPGPLSQSVTNLVMNSLIHAFEEDQAGSISISVKELDGDLEVTYRDDGAGMSDEVVKQIYEPFFTTRRGRGGSGLGMHVVYTAVTEALGGTLTCDSAPGEGTVFVMTFPSKRRVDDE